ncbi:hypothetical protein SDC9_116482 [bioreactor metagenome]|uniref:Uncharacterized protein n=1 Tax=bioreactor metagenome TaxID=1076179 RepID=A0A645BWH2_9ZZZZ
MPPEVDHRVGLKFMPEPEVNRQILMMRRQRGGVQELVRIVEPAAHGFRQNCQTAAPEHRQDEVAADGHDRGLFRRSPLLDDIVAERFGQFGEPFGVTGARQPHGVARSRQRIQFAGSPGADIARRLQQ